MFGLFKNKNFKFNCPMCGKNYNIKFNPSEVTEFDYPYWSGAGFVSEEDCTFCKLKMSLALSKSGELRAYDGKWEKQRLTHDDKLSEYHDELTDLEDELADDPENKKLEKKISQLEARIDRFEDSFANKEDKYYERQSRWEEKLTNKN